VSLAALDRARSCARHGRALRLADTRHLLASSDDALLERVVGLLRPDAVEEVTTGLEGACLIEHTAAVDSWRDALCSGPARVVEQPETGRVTVHTLRWGAALRAGGLGVLVVEEAGPVSCQIENAPPLEIGRAHV
jgi:hypothetical protein